VPEGVVESDAPNDFEAVSEGLELGVRERELV
jgi:hypothetical protein